MSKISPFGKKIVLPTPLENGSGTSTSLTGTDFKGLMDLGSGTEGKSVLEIKEKNNADNESSLLEQVVKSLADFQKQSEKNDRTRKTIVENLRKRVDGVNNTNGSVINREYNGVTTSDSFIEKPLNDRPSTNPSYSQLNNSRRPSGLYRESYHGSSPLGENIGMSFNHSLPGNKNTDVNTNNRSLFFSGDSTVTPSSDQVSPIIKHSIKSMEQIRADKKAIGVIGKNMRVLMFRHDLFRTASGVFTSLLSKFLNMR